jgi:glycosyltransferase involved in cell wall biosynthesis
MLSVGISELHGIAQESMKSPPDSVIYSEAKSSPSFISSLIKSPAKGVLSYFPGDEYDYIEAPLFPIRTKRNWIHTPADTATAMSFNFLNLPTPRIFRELYLKKLFERENFKALLYKSKAGQKTLTEYPSLNSPIVQQKSGVLYPAVREQRVVNRKGRAKIRIVFVGEFFRKGGIHVVNAFERLAVEFANIELVICADREKHFNHELREEFLAKIENNTKITLDFITRDRLFSDVLPSSDIFISPTYNESFGYALLEAMALGLPVIATNYFAIPEIVADTESGLLIDTSKQEFIANQRGYSADNIPKSFANYMDKEVYSSLRKLIEDQNLRLDMGHNGREIALSKFSFRERNMKLNDIYR